MKLLDELIARAEADARNFRHAHPGESPTERWIENSYTAALPDPGRGSHPELFSAYRTVIRQLVGERRLVREVGELRLES